MECGLDEVCFSLCVANVVGTVDSDVSKTTDVIVDDGSIVFAFVAEPGDVL